MLAILGIILIICWVLGLVMRVTGGFIHLVLLVALGLIVMHFLLAK